MTLPDVAVCATLGTIGGFVGGLVGTPDVDCALEGVELSVSCFTGNVEPAAAVFCNDVDVVAGCFDEGTRLSIKLNARTHPNRTCLLPVRIRERLEMRVVACRHPRCESDRYEQV